MIDAVISMIQPLPVGNALRLFLEPPPGAVWWRLLRKGSNTIAGHDDASAVVAYEGDSRVILDAGSLLNNVGLFYQPFYTSDGGVTWSTAPAVLATPRAVYEEVSTDAFDLLRARLELGLKEEVDRQVLSSELGYIQVYPAPPGLSDDLRFPLVTMHLEMEQPQERAIGEYIGGDDFDSDAFAWSEDEGWLASVRIEVTAWSLNADERVSMRKALRRIIIANLPVFEDAGLTTVALDLSDANLVNGEFGAPVYQAVANFSCVAPVRVGGRIPAVRTINLGVNPNE